MSLPVELTICIRHNYSDISPIMRCGISKPNDISHFQRPEVKTEITSKNCQDISGIRVKHAKYEEREDMGQSLLLKILCDR